MPDGHCKCFDNKHLHPATNNFNPYFRDCFGTHSELRVVTVTAKNTWQSFHVIRRRAGAETYKKPLHILRKSCFQDWANNGVHPNTLHAWTGHTKIETTMQHYLKVPESEYQRMAETSFFEMTSKKNCPTKCTTVEKNNIDTFKKWCKVMLIRGLKVMRATRIELAYPAWEADVLPLNYARGRHL